MESWLITARRRQVPVEKDEEKAKHMFAAVIGDLDALTREGDLVAQALLAELLSLGEEAGVTRDAVRAKQLWLDAAQQGHAEAQSMISQL